MSNGVRERTPLLGSSSTPSLDTPKRAAVLALAPYSERLVHHLLSTDLEIERPLDLNATDTSTELTILLHARHTLLLEIKSIQSQVPRAEESVAEAVIGIRKRSECVERLDKEILARLDKAEKEDNEYLTCTLWVRYCINDEYHMAALDFLAIEETPSIHLSHPLIVGYLQYLWTYGPPRPSDQEPGDQNGIFRKGERWITPKRIHFYHLLSYAVDWILSIVIALDPPSWITGDQESRDSNDSKNGEPRHVKVKFTIWLILALGILVQTIQTYKIISLRSLAFLPSLLILFLIPIKSETAYTCLLLSIPPLTIFLISPTAPSIPFLSINLLPTSTRLFGFLGKCTEGWGLVWPLILIVFGIFSISLNGDIFRMFIFDPNVALRPITPSSNEEIPVESGIAPFETRVTLFITLLILLIMATMVACLRTPRASQDHSSSSSSSSRERTDGVAGINGYSIDKWENEHGDFVARKARQNWVLATRRLLGDLGTGPTTSALVSNGGQTSHEETGQSILRIRSPNNLPMGLAVPPPFDLLLIPLDIASLVLKVAGRRQSPSFTEWEEWVYGVRYSLSVILVVPLCFPFWAFERAIARFSLSDQQ